MPIIGATAHHSTNCNRYPTRRRSIVTGANGRYSFRSVVLKRYVVPPGSLIENRLGQLGRHGCDIAHIHFFVSAFGMRKLMMQTNAVSLK
ncbi:MULTISPECIES: hypothetical protein [Burkholderiaceae]|uniref:dioxygenase family protein n=1 Tax=Burkholderiaceae TaxID=119060 RepID=UPI000975C26B|nr:MULTISPECIES: hypothetical protein [Burkholderiaceae]MCG1039379.1 hypothetical protein [Mycetohabitans sp. B7]